MQNAKARVRPANLRNIPLISVLFLFVAIAAPGQTPATAPATKAPGFYDPLPQDTGEAGLKQELRKLQTTGRLMMVVAHPDDEDGGLLTLEARGKGVQTLLMTLTRGEGGQNKTGDTFSDELGVLRTLELLAADRYYGVEQRFSRVADFGYSKTPEETFQKWGGHDVPLADIVRVIREFRPDVLMARFSGTDRDGHGHHQASAILTKEAFRAAADPNRFPEQIKEGLQPWQAKKLYIGNVCGFGAATCADENYTVKINTGEVDPVLGMSYSQFAIEGLRHQQSQGLGDLSIPSGPRYAFYKLADSTIPKRTDEKGHEKDLFDGIDTSVAGLSTGLSQPVATKVQQAAAAIDRAEKTSGNSEIAMQLISARKSLDFGFDGKVTHDQHIAFHRLIEKSNQLSKAIGLALKVDLSSTLVSSASVANQQMIHTVSPGQRVEDRFSFQNGSDKELRIDSLEMKGMAENAIYPSPMLAPPHGKYSQLFELSVPLSLCCTRPYWHRQDPAKDSVYVVDEPRFATLPFPPYPLHEQASYSLLESQNGNAGAQPKPDAAIAAAVRGVYSEPGSPAELLPVAVVPAFSLSVEPAQLIVPSTASQQLTVNVKVEATSDGAGGVLRLEAPEGWKVEPKQQAVEKISKGEQRIFKFQTSPANLAQGKVELNAVLDSHGKTYAEHYTLVTRSDLGAFYYFEPAVQHISIVNVKVPKDLKVGYIMGAGDDIPTVLQQIGMNVSLIPADKIASENLAQYGTIVLGVRAYDTHKDLVANNKKLLDFVANGGTLIVQNNNSVGDFNSEHLTPFPADLSRARVSVEEAPVQILDPGNSIFHYPNEISQKDFDGWVQERGLYFMDSWDDQFKPLLSCHDPGESDQKGGLIEAKYGKGMYIYTGYAFFRQLPAGVPGAIRLFVNLVSAGSPASSH